MSQTILPTSDTDANVHKREFDINAGKKYLCCVCSGYSFLSIIGIVCIPFAPCWAYQTMIGQDCYFDDKNIHYKSGWINKVRCIFLTFLLSCDLHSLINSFHWIEYKI